jgi:hypothetical protein
MVHEAIIEELGVLSVEEIDRIRAEEFARFQAREDAKRMFVVEKPLWSRVNEFLNSSLGLWVLSTIVIGFGTYLYKSMEERSARRTEADRLEMELRHRLSLFRKSVANLSKEVDDTQEAGNDPWGLKFASRLRNSYRYVQTAEAAFFSTYAHDNLQALFTSLQDKLRGVDDKKANAVEECFASLKLLRKTCEDDYNDVPRPDDPKIYDAYFEQIKRMIGDVQRTLGSRPMSIWAYGDSEPVKAPPS